VRGCLRFAKRQAVEDTAQLENALAFQRRVIADVEPVEVDVIGTREPLPRVRSQKLAQVRLAHLVAAARGAAAKLDAALPQARHYPLGQCCVRFAQDQRESVIAAALQREIGLVEGRIEVAEKEPQ